MVSTRIIQFLTLVLFLVLTPLFHAQAMQENVEDGVEEEVSEQQPDSTHALRAFSDEEWSLQFGISETLMLTTFDGTSLSVKRHLSSNRAFRFGLSPSSLGETRDFANDPNTVNFDEQVFGAEVDFSLMVISYSYLDRPVQFFWGIGPILNIGYSNYEAELEQIFDDGEIEMTATETINEDMSRMGIGGTALVGAEWFFTPQFSLSGEYGLRSVYTVTDTELNQEIEGEVDGENIPVPGQDEVTSNDRTTEFILEGTGVRFGLTVYF